MKISRICKVYNKLHFNGCKDINFRMKCFENFLICDQSIYYRDSLDPCIPQACYGIQPTIIKVICKKVKPTKKQKKNIYQKGDNPTLACT